MENRNWSRRTIRRGWITVGQLAKFLEVSRWTALRLLKRSGLPAQLYTRFWQDPTGRVYRRQVWGLPPQTARKLLDYRFYRFAQTAQRLSHRCGAKARRLARGDAKSLLPKILRKGTPRLPSLPNIRLPNDG